MMFYFINNLVNILMLFNQVLFDDFYRCYYLVSFYGHFVGLKFFFNTAIFCPNIPPSDQVMQDPKSSIKIHKRQQLFHQVVDFKTWSRTINGTKKESLLDHVYINNLATFCSVYFETPVFGDHVLVITELCLVRSTHTQKGRI